MKLNQLQNYWLSTLSIPPDYCTRSYRDYVGSCLFIFRFWATLWCCIRYNFVISNKFDFTFHQKQLLMKQKFTILLFIIAIITCSLGTTSCNRDAYCPAYNNVHTKTDKKGRFKKSKTKSNLFPKSMRKK